LTAAARAEAFRKRHDRQLPCLGCDERCAKDWMTGKCQLSGGSEDAHASIAAVLGRKQEDGLGQIHLPGQALHLVVAERRPVFEHRQLVPLQRRVSKYIDDHVRQ
jgi:hypothetical protein